MRTHVSLDTETFLIQPGVLAPTPVVASFYTPLRGGWFDRFRNEFQPGDQALECVKAWLQKPNTVISGANLAYDAGVLMRYAPELIPELFAKYDRPDEIFDVLIAHGLDAVAAGRMTDMGILDRNGQVLKNDKGKATGRAGLWNTVLTYLGRDTAKKNDTFRLRYGELSLLPTEQWPTEAKEYPVDDSFNTWESAEVLMAHGQNLGVIGDGTTRLKINHTHVVHQARAELIMHLGSVWGFRTDPARIAEIETQINATLEADTAKFVEWGFMESRNTGTKKNPVWEVKENRSKIKTEVALAYGADPLSQCPLCHGTAKVPSATTGKPVNCKNCDATGLEIPPSVPRTPAQGIAADRDTLNGTHSERLEAWAEASKNDKMRETYLPWLKQGIDRPINVRPNVLVATGRSSYEGLVQLIPPLARECIVARPGYVFCSVDYAALELCTLAQVCYWVLGYSRMRDTINETKDPGALHTVLGAKLAGATDLEAFAKSKESKRYRQMAKAANFGFPGLMGPAKLVLAKRKEGLNLCVASGIADKCAPPVLEWKGRELSKPTCPTCIETATDLRAEWFETWPEIQPYFAWVTSQPGVEDGEGVLTSPGTGYVRGGLHASNAANHSFQHLAAMGAKHALWKVGKECYADRSSPLYGSRPIVFVHDEIFAEVREDRMHDAAMRISELMVSAMREFVPDVHIKAVPALCRRWLKKMEDVLDENDRLIPWEPGMDIDETTRRFKGYLPKK